jgi:hypothetical protein
VWADGRELPSEDDREFKPMSAWLDGYRPPFEEKPIGYENGRARYLSKRMSRDPVILLAAIGRVITRHGEGSWVYMPGMEPHRLAVDLRRPSSTKLRRVAEPDEPHRAVELIPAPGSTVDPRYHESKDEYTVPAWDSERLGIDAGTRLRAYTLTLLIDGEPILASTSLVPSDLLTGAVKWQRSLEGELALAGVSATFSYPTLHGRIPTLNYSNALTKALKPKALKPVDGIPAFAIYRQCEVTFGISPTPVRACVLVIARTDRVHL